MTQVFFSRAKVLIKKSIRVKKFQNVKTRGIYQNGRKNEKKKNTRGEPEKQNLRINTQYFLELKSKNEEEEKR